MDSRHDKAIEAVLEQLIEHGPEGIATVFARTFEMAMRIERERFLSAGHYERTADRRGYANGYKSKRIDTPAGTVEVAVPKTAGHGAEPFFPQSLERGCRSVRAVMLAVAEMYVKGVSTRQAEAVLREFGIEGLSSSQVSRAAALLDDELEAWRTRPLGEIRYLILDARYEKMRAGGVVRDAAVLSAIGIGPDERRRVLGVSVALSEAEVHWRAFLDGLVARGMRGVEFIVSDDHAGLRAARRAVLGAATWQRCQFHLAANAIHHAPNTAIRGASGPSCAASGTPTRFQKRKPRSTNSSPATATLRLPWLHGWKTAFPRGSPSSPCQSITVGACAPPTPSSALCSRNSNADRQVRVFPNDQALLRLVSAVLVEIDETWASDNKGYIKWECRDA